MKHKISGYAQAHLFWKRYQWTISYLEESKMKVSVRKGSLRLLLLKPNFLHNHKDHQNPQYAVKMIWRTSAGPLCDFTKWKLKICILFTFHRKYCHFILDIKEQNWILKNIVFFNWMYRNSQKCSLFDNLTKSEHSVNTVTRKCFFFIFSYFTVLSLEG